MIAQVQPEDIEAGIEQVSRRGKNVERLGAAFPAVDDGDQIARPIAVAAINAGQPHPFASIKDYWLCVLA